MAFSYKNAFNSIYLRESVSDGVNEFSTRSHAEQTGFFIGFWGIRYHRLGGRHPTGNADSDQEAKLQQPLQQQHQQHKCIHRRDGRLMEIFQCNFSFIFRLYQTGGTSVAQPLHQELFSLSFSLSFSLLFDLSSDGDLIMTTFVMLILFLKKNTQDKIG